MNDVDMIQMDDNWLKEYIIWWLHVWMHEHGWTGIEGGIELAIGCVSSLWN